MVHQYSLKYKKHEKIIRRSIWERNKALVESHNKKAEKSFTMALNEASDWTEEEVTKEKTIEIITF